MKSYLLSMTSERLEHLASTLGYIVLNDGDCFQVYNRENVSEYTNNKGDLFEWMLDDSCHCIDKYGRIVPINA